MPIFFLFFKSFFISELISITIKFLYAYAVPFSNGLAVEIDSADGVSC